MSRIQYRIEGEIIFCPNASGFYHESAQDEIVPIASSATRLLSFLIKNKGEIVNRELLLKKVWDDYGLQASSNNLNQCLSTLRRIIKSMGIEKNVIETIPKVGLRISDDITIEEISLHRDSKIPENNNAPQKKASKINLTHCLIILVVALVATSLLHVFHIYNYYKLTHSSHEFQEQKHAQCELPATTSIEAHPLNTLS